MMRRADDMILISVDDHIAEPADMFDQHVPAQYKDRAPRVETDEHGHQQWWYGEKQGRNLGLNAVAGKPREMYNVNPSRYEDMRPGCYDVHERVRDMSAGGQLAGLNFPNWTGFSGQVLNEGPDPVVNEVMIKAYNDWHVDEWCGAYPERFIPCGILPLFDVDKAAAEGRPPRPVLGDPARPSHAVHPLGPLGPAVRGVRRGGHRPVPARRLLVQVRRHHPRRPGLGADEPVVGHVHLLAGRPHVGRLLVAVPGTAVRADGGRHRLDPLLPPAGRAHPG